MLFLRRDAAAHSNALNGLFGADVVIGGNEGPRSERRPTRQASCYSDPTRPPLAAPGRQAPTAARGPAPTIAPRKRPATAGRMLAGDPGARLWASWVISRALSA